VSREEGRVHIGDAIIVEADVPAENGIIHLVDGLVWLPEG
jgi:uncharacterized surface protein with fasciclin (FAS1) repeats